MKGSIVFSGTCYRMKFRAEADDILAPAHSPEGRSHYNGQKALYLSQTPEGTITAVRRYVVAGDPERAIFPLLVRDAHVVDLRDACSTRLLDIDVTHRAIEWQKIREAGKPSPTWDISDRVRALSLDGMIYASRTDPTKTHLTLFRWNADGGPLVQQIGEPTPFSF